MSKRNLLFIGLLLSLGINLFLLGAIGSPAGNVRNFREARPLPPNLSWINPRPGPKPANRKLVSLIEPLADEIVH